MSYCKLRVKTKQGQVHTFTFSPDYMWRDLLALVQGDIIGYSLIRNGVVEDHGLN